MSFVIAAPEMMTSAATDLAGIGSTLSAANAAAAAPTTGVVAAAEDEVSAAIAALFSGHGQVYQALSAQVAAFHEQFVHALTMGAGSYVGAEAANAAAFAANPVASAAAAQVAPWQQSLYNLSSRLAALLGLNPVTNFGPFAATSLSDPDDHYFDLTSFSDPSLVTDTLTSGFDPTLGLGAPGQTINMIQSPVFPFLNSSFALPVTDPIARLFWALLPLGA